MRYLLVLLYIWSVAEAQELESPYQSSVKGISIRNTHEVDTYILRGMVPRRDYEIEELDRYGVKKILIFRNDVEGESASLAERNLIEQTVGSKIQIEHIPFQWRDLTEFKEPCLQLLQALRHLRDAEVKEETIFFHCTVGEDRTGLLTGMYRHLFNPWMSKRTVFREEMCARGYGRGNPGKEEWVVDLIHRNLTDLYVKMLYLVQTKRLTRDLNDRACDRDPSLDKAFQAAYKSSMERYRCPLFYPQ